MSATTSEPWTVRRVVGYCADDFQRRGLSSPRLDAELLVAHALETDRVHLYMELERVLDEDALTRVRALVQRRRRREPIAYLVGKKEFWGREFAVSPAVLVPRPDTETLVERALELLAARDPRPHGDAELDASPAQREWTVGAPTRIEVLDASSASEELARADEPPIAGASLVEPAPRSRPVTVLDLGTGSGAIGLTLACELPEARVTITDVSAAALEIARANLARFSAADPTLATRVVVLEGDLFAPLPDGACFDLIASNPPYLAERELAGCEPDVREHEPRIALVAGPEGDELVRRVVEGARPWLEPGGRLLVEIGSAQGDVVRALFERAGYEDVRVLRDLAGHDRVVEGRRAGPR